MGENVSQEKEEEQTKPEAEEVPKEKEKPKEKPKENFPALDRAEQVRDGINEANKKHEELLDRHEALMAKQALGGQTDGGSIKTPEQIDQDKIDDEVDKAVKGFD